MFYLYKIFNSYVLCEREWELTYLERRIDISVHYIHSWELGEMRYIEQKVIREFHYRAKASGKKPPTPSQNCCNPSTNYPWYCFNDQQHPFNDGLRKQGGFICINTVYIWYTMDCPANGLLITNMHILTLRPSVYRNLPTGLCKPRYELVSINFLERSFQISRLFLWLYGREFSWICPISFAQM